MIRQFFYSKPINYVVRSLLKVIGNKKLIPINGIIKIKIKDIAFLMDGNETSYVNQVFFWQGADSYEYSLIMYELFKRAKGFLDIGSNIGYYSLMGAAINKEMDIHAFEPVDDIYEYLQRNVKLNSYSNIVTHQVAVANYSGEDTFLHTIKPKWAYVKNQLSGDSNLVNYHNRDSTTSKSIKVEVVNGDDYIKTLNINKIDIIKIDVEGVEHLVIEALKQTILYHKPILIFELIKNKGMEENIEDLLIGAEIYELHERTASKLNSLYDTVNEISNVMVVFDDKKEWIKEFIT